MESLLKTLFFKSQTVELNGMIKRKKMEKDDEVASAHGIIRILCIVHYDYIDDSVLGSCTKVNK